jgi:hypothetical protein
VPEAAIRVAVGSPNEMHSSVWRIWSHKDEMYISSSGLKYFAKLSLHSSGVWRLAELRARTGPNPYDPSESDPRVMHRWDQPPHFADGWTQCLNLVIPSVFVPERFPAPEDVRVRPSKVEWIRAPSVGHVTVFVLLMAASAELDPRTVMKIGDRTICYFNLDSGRVAWLVLHQEEMSMSDYSIDQGLVGDMKITHTDDPGSGAFAALMSVGTDRGGVPMILEMALGRNNIRIDPGSG